MSDCQLAGGHCRDLRDVGANVGLALEWQAGALDLILVSMDTVKLDRKSLSDTLTVVL